MKPFPKNLITLCFLALILGLQASPALSAPATGVTASDGLWAGSVRVDWTSIYTGGFHNVKRRDDGSGTYILITQIPIDGSTVNYFFNDSTAVRGTTYHYRIKSCYDITCETSLDDPGWRGYINTVTGINASDWDSPDHVFVNWNSTTNADYYEVYRSSTIGGEKTSLGRANSIFFYDTEVTPHSRAYYYVQACNYDMQRCSEFYDYDDGIRSSSPVENVVASDGDHVGFVRVTWDAINGATGYRVHYSENGGTDYLGYETVTGVELYDYVLPVVDFEYTFAVVSCFDTQCGSIQQSIPDNGWPALPAPVNLSADDGIWSSRVWLTWDEVDPSAWYYVFRESLNSPAGKTLLPGAGATETLSDDFDDGALPGVYYNYWVVACPLYSQSATAPGCSDYSEPDSGHYYPKVVGNLSASDGTSQDHVLVSWDVVDGASYEIERSENPYAPAPVWTGPYSSATNSYTDTSALEGVRYGYRVKACGADYCGDTGSFDTGYLQGICYALTVDIVGNGTEVVSPQDSFGCPLRQYIEGEEISLQAIPDPDWKLESWANTDSDESTGNFNNLTMPANAHAVTITFSLDCKVLTLNTVGNGTLTADPLFTDGCPAGSYMEGEVIALQATPDKVWIFDNWSGTDNDLSTETTNQYTMTASVHTVTAEFSSPCWPLSLDTVGNGTLEAEPLFSSGCSAGTYTEGEVINLNIRADSGWLMDSWSGTDDDTDDGWTNKVTMPGSAHTVTATFILLCNTLDMKVNGPGTLEADPLFSTGCSAGTYVPDEVINLIASPDTGWRVGAWNGTDDDSSTAATNTLTMGTGSTYYVWVVFYPNEPSIFSNGFESE